MLPGSELTEDLRRLPVPTGSELVSLARGDDLLVPERCARLTPMKGQRTVRLPNASHTSFLLSRAVFAVVSAALESGPVRVGMPVRPHAVHRPIWALQPIASTPMAAAVY